MKTENPYEAPQTVDPPPEKPKPPSQPYQELDKHYFIVAFWIAMGIVAVKLIFEAF